MKALKDPLKEPYSNSSSPYGSLALPFETFALPFADFCLALCGCLEGRGT